MAQRICQRDWLEKKEKEGVSGGGGGIIVFDTFGARCYSWAFDWPFGQPEKKAREQKEADEKRDVVEKKRRECCEEDANCQAHPANVLFSLTWKSCKEIENHQKNEKMTTTTNVENQDRQKVDTCLVWLAVFSVL